MDVTRWGLQNPSGHDHPELVEGLGRPKPEPAFICDRRRSFKMSSNKIAERRCQLRQRLWPDVSDDDLWDRKTSKGWLSVPRTMPIIP